MAQSSGTADYWREQDRALVELTASGATGAAGMVDVRQLGLARAELYRRNREDAEQQEHSRREFEMGLEAIRNQRETEQHVRCIARS